MSLAQTAIVSALVAAAALAVYHVAIAPKALPASGPGDASASAEEVAALRREVEAFRKAAAGGGAPSSAASASLAARISALEGRLIPASAEAGANNARLPAGVGSRSFTEEQLESLRAMLDEVEARRNTDRETASFRDL